MKCIRNSLPGSREICIYLHFLLLRAVYEFLVRPQHGAGRSVSPSEPRALRHGLLETSIF